jgi:hypothetical protein
MLQMIIANKAIKASKLGEELGPRSSPNDARAEPEPEVANTPRSKKDGATEEAAKDQDEEQESGPDCTACGQSHKACGCDAFDEANTSIPVTF